MGYYNRKASVPDKYVKWGLIGLVAVVLLAFGKTLLNRFSSGFALLGAKKDGDNLYNQNNSDNPSNVRTIQVKAIVDSVRKEISSLNQDEVHIVTLMNQLLNGQEATYASAEYSRAYGRSLKTDLETSLDSGWNPFTWFGSKSSFSDLKDYIRQNLA